MQHGWSVNPLLDYISYIQFSDLIGYLADYIGLRDPLAIVRALVDISIVSYLLYKAIMLVKETRAWQLLKGILLIAIAYYISNLLQLKTVEFIMSNVIQLAGITAVILFQPELRRALEHLGRSKFKDLFSFEDGSSAVRTTAMIEELVKTAVEMSKTKTGVLVVIEKDTKIGEIINTGVLLDSALSSELLINIFTPNTPLHDGAVVIRDTRIKAAACFLPLTDNPNLSKELGTRHRAALGITEVSDCVAIVVSEETGKISFAMNGGLTRNLNSDTLRMALNKTLLEKNTNNKKIGLWKVKPK